MNEFPRLAAKAFQLLGLACLLAFSISSAYSEPEAPPAAEHKPVVVSVPDLDGNLHPMTGRDAILYCVMVNDTTHLGQLLAEGHDIKRPFGDQGLTFLHLAAQHGFIASGELLIRHGADLNARNADGLTPLDLAIGSDHMEMAVMLRARATVINGK